MSLFPSHFQSWLPRPPTYILATTAPIHVAAHNSSLKTARCLLMKTCIVSYVALNIIFT